MAIQAVSLRLQGYYMSITSRLWRKIRAATNMTGEAVALAATKMKIHFQCPFTFKERVLYIRYLQ